MPPKRCSFQWHYFCVPLTSIVLPFFLYHGVVQDISRVFKNTKWWFWGIAWNNMKNTQFAFESNF